MVAARVSQFQPLVAKSTSAAGLVAALDMPREATALCDRARELFEQGDRYGDNRALTEAIDSYRRCLALVPRAESPLDWALTQINLGVALETLGERESETARFEESLAAFREALQENTRERAPIRWARTQMNLGDALMALGARESGTARLEEGLAAYREALKEVPRESGPVWGIMQEELGDALVLLGERESGTARLEEAVAAYQEALQENTRAREPLFWARTQMGLGNALETLGARESGTARLEEALAAYREALQEFIRERAPRLWPTAQRWATAQMNLGNALEKLAVRESGTARLEEAVTAYREALKENTRARVPLHWAQTQKNLAIAYFAFFDKTHEPPYLDDALGAVGGALEQFRKAKAAFYIEKAEQLRQLILATKGKL